MPEEVENTEEVQEQEVDELEALRNENEELISTLQHLQADFENFRKRVMKQHTDDVARAPGRLVEKLLPSGAAPSVAGAADSVVAAGAPSSASGSSAISGAVPAASAVRSSEAPAWLRSLSCSPMSP